MTVIVNGHALVITGWEIVVGLGIDVIWISLALRLWHKKKRKV